MRIVTANMGCVTLSVIAEIDDAGNSTVQHGYQTVDENPFERIGYYRLRNP